MSATAEPCVRLPWDSEFFGINIARVTGDSLDHTQALAVDTWCQREHIDCLYFLARADDAVTSLCAQTHGYSLVDIRVDFARAARLNAAAQAADKVRPATAADLPALEQIARVSFTDSRFYADTHFPRAQCDALYERWIRESCRGFADLVLVALHEGLPAAFITCKRAAASTGRIGLVGVDARHRGRGLGQLLCHAACDWFAAQSLTGVMVATQGRNIASQRLYQRCGFLTHSVGLYYHKWYESGPREKK
jgi:dTDP-4-amino-4,6-dideoxy-D-galactose acyltransferase